MCIYIFNINSIVDVLCILKFLNNIIVFFMNLYNWDWLIGVIWKYLCLFMVKDLLNLKGNLDVDVFGLC